MTNYIVVEPRFELFEPCTPVNYMQFLELCTRNCYKSEEHIKIGSAEKLLKKVVNDFGHYSVVEHANCILQISNPWIVEDIFQEFALYNPLLRLSFREAERETLLVSGNIRMWKDFLSAWPPPGKTKCAIGHGIDECLATQFPFFFEAPHNRPHRDIRLVDCNPVTNNDELTEEEMLKHMTMTGRFVGSRTMSHQLVRHRLAAYSQESQRYCNYGKKGLRVILPPSIKTLEDDDHKVGIYLNWLGLVAASYKRYTRLLEAGIPPEDARSVLPNATKTEVVATYTLGIWKHVIEHRGHNHKAQWEIRDLSLEAERQLHEKIPTIF